MRRFRNPAGPWLRLLRDPEGSSLLEFAITLPLLVVFIVGIYDFSGAFNQKQKLEHAAQVGAIFAGSQPTSDIEVSTDTSNGDPQSLHPVVAVIFNSLAAQGVLAQAGQGTCNASSAVVTPNLGSLQWRYAIHGCPDILSVVINRSWIPQVSDSTKTVGTLVTVTYPYHWRFNRVIQLLIPGASYSATTVLSETAKVHNQL
jgi:Flp pilus assembly protein TadG